MVARVPGWTASSSTSLKNAMNCGSIAAVTSAVSTNVYSCTILPTYVGQSLYKVVKSNQTYKKLTTTTLEAWAQNNCNPLISANLQGKEGRICNCELQHSSPPRHSGGPSSVHIAHLSSAPIHVNRVLLVQCSTRNLHKK